MLKGMGVQEKINMYTIRIHTNKGRTEPLEYFLDKDEAFGKQREYEGRGFTASVHFETVEVSLKVI